MQDEIDDLRDYDDNAFRDEDDYGEENTQGTTDEDSSLITGDEDGAFEKYEEETEEIFLAQAQGNPNAANNNQISKKSCAFGPKTESISNPCNVVMVAEKPSIALSITEALSGKRFSKKTGPARQCPIYVFSGFFKGHKATFKVTSVAGHVFNRDFPT